MNELQNIEIERKEQIKQLVSNVRNLLIELQNYIFNEKRAYYVTVKEYASKVGSIVDSIEDLSEVAIEDEEYITNATSTLEQLAKDINEVKEAYIANKKVTFNEEAEYTIEEPRVLDENAQMLEDLKVDKVETTLPTQDVFVDDIQGTIAAFTEPEAIEVPTEVEPSVVQDAFAFTASPEIPDEVDAAVLEAIAAYQIQPETPIEIPVDTPEEPKMEAPVEIPTEIPVAPVRVNYLDESHIQDAVSFDTMLIPVVVADDYSDAVDTAGMDELIAPTDNGISPAIKF